MTSIDSDNLKHTGKKQSQFKGKIPAGQMAVPGVHTCMHIFTHV